MSGQELLVVMLNPKMHVGIKLIGKINEVGWAGPVPSSGKPLPLAISIAV